MNNKHFWAKKFSPTPQIEKSRKFCSPSHFTADHNFFVLQDTLMKLEVFFSLYENKNERLTRAYSYFRVCRDAFENVPNSRKNWSFLLITSMFMRLKCCNVV